MDIGLTVKGHVVIDDEGNAFHVQAPGRDIGCHQHIHLAIAQPLDGALPEGLGHITVEHRHVVAVFFEGFGNGEADCFGAGKNDHALAAFGLQHPFEGLKLLGAWTRMKR